MIFRTVEVRGRLRKCKSFEREEFEVSSDPKSFMGARRLFTLWMTDGRFDYIEMIGHNGHPQPTLLASVPRVVPKEPIVLNGVIIGYKS